VLITGENAKIMLFGAICVRTGYRVVVLRLWVRGADARAFLREKRSHYRWRGTIWLLANHGAAYAGSDASAG